ncbi:carbohydrate-binding module family 13 protein [Rhizophagus irregularis DAOM 181602=DAOM 197198]|nr:carbohydrate-binding module family 13 protein [Rhizophagus irregularis DAOM 181602=DAOM 197198]
MVAASELNLQELVIYTQSFLINYKADWMEQNFSLEILSEELFTDLLRSFLNLHPDSKKETFSWDNGKPVSLGHIDEWRTNPKPISLNERPNPWNRSWSKVAKSNQRPISSDEWSKPRSILPILSGDNSSRSSSWSKVAKFNLRPTSSDEKSNPRPISSDDWSNPILLGDNSSRSSSWSKIAKSNPGPISSDDWSKPKSILLDDNSSRSSSWSKKLLCLMKKKQQAIMFKVIKMSS